MKAVIQKVTYVKEYETKFGVMFLHKIEYSGKTGYYSSKSKNQTKFVEGKECEFIEETQKGNNGEYIKIKPQQTKGYSNFGKALKKEQSKYSGFAMSYAKDIKIAYLNAGKEFVSSEMFKLADAMFKWMVEKDKSIENDNN